MPRKLLFVVNPNAGKGAIHEKALSCIDLFVRAGFEVTVYTTQQTRDATRIVQERAAEFERIVCSGGDGTFNEVVSGLIEGGHQVPIGYIPAGTVNDFASSLFIPKQVMEAAKIAAGEDFRKVDIGLFGKRHFCYVAAFGAFTNVSYTTPQMQKNLLGRTAYILEGIKSLPTVKPYEIQIETEEGVRIEDEFIYGMISNATSIGGFKELTPRDVRMDDGLFEVVLVRQPKTPIEWQNVFNDLVQPNGDSKFLMRFKTPILRVSSKDEISWTLDGEFGGKLRDVQISNQYQALTIFSHEQ